MKPMVNVELGENLNPITKLEVFRACKNIIFLQMDRNIISPERGEEILNYIKQHIYDINTTEEIKEFYIHIEEKYLELRGVRTKFESVEEEKIDTLIIALIEEFLLEGSIDLAGEIMDQVKALNNDKEMIVKLESLYPKQFAMALEKQKK